MFKCTGICSKCGRCRGAAMMSGANDRKTKMLTYPADFKADTGETGFGAAFDIGTTTVVGMLWDLEKGEQIAACAGTNPQNEFGMDVISRINFCGQDESGLALLQEKIRGCINEIIRELCRKAEINQQEILKVSVCGNTTMSHIFAGYPPGSLARAPFAPAYTGSLHMTAQEAGLAINESGSIFVAPNIAGHVGGDIAAGLVAARLPDKTGVTLLIDIGTNGEIVLTDEITMLACSTAAGPAFEGASIKHGMRAAEGAIEKVMFADGEVVIKTIGDHEPQGICGSGLIDALAQMLEHKLINKSGRLACAEDAETFGFAEAFCSSLVDLDGERAFVLAEKEDGSVIAVFQSDIREVQLAKGAIAAGIELMLLELDKDVTDITQIIVAGAFGNYIDKQSAIRIGLLPEIDNDKIISAGNTAGAGVSMALASEAERNQMERILQDIRHIELAEKENFQRVYLASMGFRQ